MLAPSDKQQQMQRRKLRGVRVSDEEGSRKRSFGQDKSQETGQEDGDAGTRYVYLVELNIAFVNVSFPDILLDSIFRWRTFEQVVSSPPHTPPPPPKYHCVVLNPIFCADSPPMFPQHPPVASPVAPDIHIVHSLPQSKHV